MPIYRYKCSTPMGEPFETIGEYGEEVLDQEICEHEYEVFYSSIPRAEAEEPGEACPKCGGKDKKRLISTGTSHTLKGKGWYKDGY